MALAFNSGGTTVVSHVVNGSPGSGTFASDITTTGTNRVGYLAYYLVVDPFYIPPLTAEWGSGNTMTLVDAVADPGDNSEVGLLKFVNPPTALTTIAYVGGSALGNIIFVAFSGQDNDQTTSLGTAAHAAGASSLAVPSNTGELALMVLGAYVGGGSATIDAPATTIAALTPVSVGSRSLVVGYDTGANPTVTISTTGTLGSQLAVGASLKPVGGGGGGAFPHYYYQRLRQRQPRFTRRGSIYVPAPLARAA